MKERIYADNIKVVSFDIFDTLILRPFVKPTDLFGLIEQNEKRPGFSKARIEAERKAREKKGHGVRLNEIYEMIPDYKGLMDIECRYEIDLAILNQPILDELLGLYEDKTIVIASDMYLPEDVLAEILSKFDIPYHKLYVSSSLGIAKHDGRMFDMILQEFSIKPEELLHIGDNKYSDVRTPRSMGILTEYHEKPIKSYLRRNADERRFYKRSGSLTSSIIVSMDMVREENQDVWWDIGERYGGPLTYSYSKFLVDHTDDSSLLLFAARDGYTLMRAVESLGLTNDSKYIYVQRLFSKVLHDEDVLKGRTIALPSRFSDSVGYKRTMMRLKTILSFFSRDLNLEKLDDGTSLEKAYNLNRGRIAALCRKARADYNHTLCELCGDRKIELVDCTTMRHSSQKLVEKTIGRGIHAHNLLILRDYDRGLSFDCLYQWPHTFIGWSRVDIPEFLLCSPELPVCGWSNGKPVFDDDAPSFEKDRAQHYPDVSDGELKYIERMTTIFSDHLPVFDYIDVNRWVLLSAAKGTRYRNLLKDIKWASGADHSDWAPIIPWDGMINRLKRISIDFLSKLNDD